MKLNNLSASAFAAKIGVQPSSISHILSGRNKPSLEFIQKILIHFPNVSADWLITGSKNINENTLFTKVEEAKKPTPTLPYSTIASEKRIKKIVLIYADNTFEEIIKNN